MWLAGQACWRSRRSIGSARKARWSAWTPIPTSSRSPAERARASTGAKAAPNRFLRRRQLRRIHQPVRTDVFRGPGHGASGNDARAQARRPARRRGVRPLERSPGYAALADMLERLFGNDVANAFRAPFVLGKADLIHGLCAEAGISGAKVKRISGTVRFASIDR